MSEKAIIIRFRLDGALHDATSVKLSDPTGEFGMRRKDTQAVVVADGVDLNHDGVGIYSKTVTGLTGGAPYEYWIEWAYGGSIQRREFEFIAVPESVAAAGAGPSGLLLGDSVTIERDVGAAKTPSGARITAWEIVAAGVPANIQIKSAEELDVHGRREMRSRANVYFGQDVGIDEQCRIDDNGSAKFIIVDSFRDMAGRRRVFVASGFVYG